MSRWKMMPAASIKKHKLNSDAVPTFFIRKANHGWKSVTPLVFISKLSTDGGQTSSGEALKLFARKSAVARRERIAL